MTTNNIKETMKLLNSYSHEQTPPFCLSFEQFLTQVAQKPQKGLRNIFQLFCDMIHHYVPKGYNEYPNDPESINYIKYDMSKLLVKNVENPFFADRLLANRLINVADSLKNGVVKNKMLLFVGPPGSGKSTFLNNLLHKLELYTKTEQGRIYETVWKIDVEKFGVSYIPGLMDKEILKLLTKTQRIRQEAKTNCQQTGGKYLSIKCPNHDHPIIQIPQEHRKELLNKLITDKQFKKQLFTRKEYEWIFKQSPCPVCSALYKSLHEKLTMEEIFSMLYVKHYDYSRKMGEGISVYNPSDKVNKSPLKNPELQKWLDAIFKSSNAVPYIYSRLAMTNNGIFAIMDVKSNNIERIKNIHGVISDGVHKVGVFEETINSLFMTLINPEDTNVIYKEKSFKDRVVNIPIPYVRDYNTEVEIFRNTFQKEIDQKFLPRVLLAFAKIIVSSRLNKTSKTLEQWIKNPQRYYKFCDKQLLLLKMEIFGGTLPSWLEENDIKRLDKKLRRQLIIEGDAEGRQGFSGRESVEMFNNFYSSFKKYNQLINMKDVITFFKNPKYKEKISEDFLDAVVRLYNYIVLQEVKESMFYYNQEQIANDICDYIFAINNEQDTQVICPFTKNKITINKSYFQSIEIHLLPKNADQTDREIFRNDILRKYVAKTLQEINSGTPIKQTELYLSIYKKYTKNLKQNVLLPFIKNKNFRRAILDYNQETFSNYDQKVRNEVTFLLHNLQNRFNYCQKGAKQICIYTLDNKLYEQF